MAKLKQLTVKALIDYFTEGELHQDDTALVWFWSKETDKMERVFEHNLYLNYREREK